MKKLLSFILTLTVLCSVLVSGAYAQGSASAATPQMYAKLCDTLYDICSNTSYDARQNGIDTFTKIMRRETGLDDAIYLLENDDGEAILCVDTSYDDDKDVLLKSDLPFLKQVTGALLLLELFDSGVPYSDWTVVVGHVNADSSIDWHKATENEILEIIAAGGSAFSDE